MNRTKSLICLVGLSVLVLSSCTEEKLQTGSDPAEVAGKIINVKGTDFKNDEILVKFNEVPDDMKIAAFEDLNGVISVKKIFPDVAGKEELRERFGLDRWYCVAIETSADATFIAESLEEDDVVEIVQYSMNYVKASDGIVYPYVPSADGTTVNTTAVSSSTFNDPYFSDQWNYVNSGNVNIASSAYHGGDINVSQVWSSITCGDSDIIVAVVDEGVKYTHPDLAANMWVNPGEVSSNGTDDDGNGYVDDIYGWNFVSDGPVTWDAENDTGHGTHCAGIIAAVNNNGVGVSGIAGGSGAGDGVRIMSCQIFDSNVSASSQQIARAIIYAADNGASVISCSYGYSGGAYMSDGAYKRGNAGTNTLEYEALMYFESTKNNDVLDGGIAIFAAGNDALAYAGYPGALSEIISVSAFGPDFLPAYYTNYGPGCNITAPGGEAYLNPWTEKSMILSTVHSEVDGSDYGYMQGTSMACPHVTGVVALGLSYAKQLGKTFTVDEFKSMILVSVNDFETRLASGTKDYATGSDRYFTSVPLSNYRNQMGTGAIDAWRLMMKIEGTPCLTAETGSNQWLDLSDYFGESSTSLTYLDVECLDDAYDAIGLAQDPYIRYGRLYIYPTVCGSAKFRITAVAGGTEVGSDSAIGGMEISQDVSVVVRSVKSSSGGWL